MPTKSVTRNRKALHDYEVLDKVVAGIELQGTEVKSVRAGRINLTDSYATCTAGELYVHHLHISPFEQGNIHNHDPYRRRRLLLHRREIDHLGGEVARKHLALVPLSVFFERQWVKVELGLCRGRKKYDKRQKIAAEEARRRIAELPKTGGR